MSSHPKKMVGNEYQERYMILKVKPAEMSSEGSIEMSSGPDRNEFRKATKFGIGRPAGGAGPVHGP